MRKGNGWRGARRYLAAVDTRPRVPVTGDDDRRALSPDEIHERRDALAGPLGSAFTVASSGTSCP